MKFIHHEDCKRKNVWISFDSIPPRLRGHFELAIAIGTVSSGADVFEIDNREIVPAASMAAARRMKRGQK